LVHLIVAVIVSIAGTLVTVVVFKPAAILSAVILPVLAELGEQALGRPAAALVSRRGSSRGTEGLTPERPNLRAAMLIGGLGFLIAAAVLAAVTLASGESLKETPTIGGSAIVNKTGDDGGGGGGFTDSDGDGVADSTDNCPTVANDDQADLNGAGRGDACDPDDDNDDVPDDQDNCPTVKNPGQEDSDPDAQNGGDACTEQAADRDADGVLDAEDNCPDVKNPGQEDADGDAAENGGDACDEDDDNDGVGDEVDAFPNDASQ